jgi:biotin transporter BioY
MDSDDKPAAEQKLSAPMKAGLAGATFGALAVFLLGFVVAGWVTGNTAEEMAKERARTAVVGVLAPICADRFQHTANAPAKLAQLEKAAPPEQVSLIALGGWATMPGETVPDADVAKACVNILEHPKS